MNFVDLEYLYLRIQKSYNLFKSRNPNILDDEVLFKYTFFDKNKFQRKTLEQKYKLVDQEILPTDNIYPKTEVRKIIKDADGFIKVKHGRRKPIHHIKNNKQFIENSEIVKYPTKDVFYSMNPFTVLETFGDDTYEFSNVGPILQVDETIDNSKQFHKLCDDLLKRNIIQKDDLSFD
jgi:hypothetical protein